MQKKNKAYPCKRKSLFDRCCCNSHNNHQCCHNGYQNDTVCTCFACGYCDCCFPYFYPTYPIPPTPPVPPLPSILKVETYQYTALSDGQQRVYTNQDRIEEYGSTLIVDPATVSYVNLFINGMLQPTVFYKVEEGRLTLLDSSGSVPEKGVPIILQFVKIFGGTLDA